jgi:hypothetical protein
VRAASIARLMRAAHSGIFGAALAQHHPQHQNGVCRRHVRAAGGWRRIRKTGAHLLQALRAAWLAHQAALLRAQHRRAHRRVEEQRQTRHRGAGWRRVLFVRATGRRRRVGATLESVFSRMASLRWRHAGAWRHGAISAHQRRRVWRIIARRAAALNGSVMLRRASEAKDKKKEEEARLKKLMALGHVWQ